MMKTGMMAVILAFLVVVAYAQTATPACKVMGEECSGSTECCAGICLTQQLTEASTSICVESITWVETGVVGGRSTYYVTTGTGGAEERFSLQKTWIGFGWERVAFIALASVSLIVALAYMIGYMFQHDRIKNWAKGEFYELMASTMLVIGLIVLIDLVLTQAIKLAFVPIMKQITGLNVPGVMPEPFGIRNPFGIVYLYLNSGIRCMKTLYLEAYWANMFFEALQDTCLILGGMITFCQFWLTPITSALHGFIGILNFLLLFFYLQRNMLLFIDTTMLTIFLPLGIVLRTFAPTRGAGGFLIAFSLGMYVVYPLSYAIVLAAGVKPIFAGEQSGECTGMGQMGRYCGGINNFAEAKFKAELEKPKLQSWLNNKMAMVNDMYAIGVYYPLLSGIITFTFIRSSALFFGAQIREVGQGLVKLI